MFPPLGSLTKWWWLGRSGLLDPERVTAENGHRWRGRKLKQKLRGNDLYYNGYLKSAAWEWRRQRCLKRAGYCCSWCGSKNTLQAHHNSYDRIGRESVYDLTCGCRRCHFAWHKLIGWH